MLCIKGRWKLLSVDKLKALLKNKRELLTRGLKSFENFLQSDFDQQLILKAYEKVTAIKTDLDQLIDQLCSIDDFPSSDLTDELKTHETYSINFEKLEELYFEHMNFNNQICFLPPGKIFKEWHLFFRLLMPVILCPK